MTMDTGNRPQSSKPALDQLTISGGGTAHECRNSVRIPYQSTVELNSPTGPAKGATRNISIGGLFVDTKISSCVGQKLEMNFRFRSGYHRMKLQAQVVRKTSEGLGLKLI
jgi:PilZ domain